MKNRDIFLLVFSPLWVPIAFFAIVSFVTSMIGFHEVTNVRGKVLAVSNNKIVYIELDNDEKNNIIQMEIRDQSMKDISYSVYSLYEAMENKGKVCNVTGIGRLVPLMGWYPKVSKIKCNK
jgi:hypothetical protein